MSAPKDASAVFRDVVRTFASELGGEPPLVFDPATPLLGPGSVVESIDVVTLIMRFEEALSTTFDTPIRLTDERAMSQARSPFRTMGSLVEYASALVPAAKSG